jgi:pimeloyl-ACP methyl ester carboxylesterase
MTPSWPRPELIRVPDGRVLELFLAGPADGTPLVFHSGTPGSGLPSPELVAAAAARGLRYVSWNRPGYGGSTRQPGRDVAAVADDVRAVLDRLGASRAFVLGWSGGGPHALATAALLPERVRSAAVIAGVAPYPAPGIDWFEGMGTENVEEFNAALDGPEALIAFKERAWPLFRDITGAQVADALGDLIDDVDRGSLTGAFAEWAAATWREGLREGYWGWFDEDLAFARPWGFDPVAIQVPVHIWQGGHDRMVPVAHGRWLVAHCGSACPHLDPAQGHLTLMVDSLEAILDELVAPPGGGAAPA